MSQGTVCADGTTGDCPDGCTDDGNSCSGSGACEWTGGNLEPAYLAGRRRLTDEEESNYEGRRRLGHVAPPPPTPSQCPGTCTFTAGLKTNQDQATCEAAGQPGQCTFTAAETVTGTDVAPGTDTPDQYSNAATCSTTVIAECAANTVDQVTCEGTTVTGLTTDTGRQAGGRRLEGDENIGGRRRLGHLPACTFTAAACTSCAAVILTTAILT